MSPQPSELWKSTLLPSPPLPSPPLPSPPFFASLCNLSAVTICVCVCVCGVRSEYNRGVELAMQENEVGLLAQLYGMMGMAFAGLGDAEVSNANIAFTESVKYGGDVPALLTNAGNFWAKHGDFEVWGRSFTIGSPSQRLLLFMNLWLMFMLLLLYAIDGHCPCAASSCGP